ncbi:MAG TPA: UvrD-helicase domain-containing protein [Polyangiaceae bacterium]
MTGGDDRLYAFRANLMIAASAGTGKTFRLASLYVLLALGLTSMGEDDDALAAAPLSPARIAATTFSRAAAAEIRERVERVLGAVASGEFSDATAAYRDVLAARVRKIDGPDLASNAMRERATTALRDLPNALIDTLHGLAARQVRASALELGVSPAFEILDEQDARISTEAAIEDVLSAALAEGEPAAMDLLDAGGGLGPMRARIADFLDRIDEEGAELNDLDLPDHASSARQMGRELHQLCTALVAAQSKSFGEHAAAATVALSRWEDGAVEAADLSGALTPLFGVRSPSRPLPIEEAFTQFRDSITGESNPHRARRLAAFLADAPALGPRARAVGGLLSRIAERRFSARRRSGALGFGDLLRIARQALAAAPQRASAFDALLVDEFQDTSRAQRDLIYLLRERPPSRGAIRVTGRIPTAVDLEPSGLLLVGDRKQSIYGFRGADVTVFSRVAAELVGAEAVTALELGSQFEAGAKPNAGLISLVENRRSHPDILDFVNWFASEDFATTKFPFDIRYAASEHLVPAAGRADAPSSPRVVVVKDSDDDAAMAELPPSLRAIPASMREPLIAASLIDDAVRSSPFGSLAFRDVAVLVRRRATLPLLEFALARYGVPFIVAGRGLFDTPEVRDAGALLRLILDPYDRNALATVLRGPALTLNDTSLLLLSRPGEGLLPSREWFREPDAPAARLAPAERERLAHFQEVFEHVRKVCLGLAPADALRYVLETLGVEKVVAALPRSAQRMGNLERLIAIASSRGGSLPAFVRWLDQQIADQRDESEAAVVSDDEDAVKLLTIHASKGLEFRAVVLLDMAATPRAAPLTLALAPEQRATPARFMVRHVQKGGGTLFTPEGFAHGKMALARETAERRRLTYVAMTRAREHLFLLLPPGSPLGSAAAAMHAALNLCPSPPGAVVQPAAMYLARPAGSASETVNTEAALPFVARSDSAHASIAVATTPLATFADCPRRYRLIHELGLEPPRQAYGADSASIAEARALGTAAHKVLETWPLSRWGEPTNTDEVLAPLLTAVDADEMRPDAAAAREMAERVARFLGGPYAAHVRTDAAEVKRETSFAIEVKSNGRSLRLRGTIDLLVVLADGSAEIIDYKSSTRGAGHRFQLRAYGLAVRRRYGFATVRAGVASLADAPSWPELTPIGDADLNDFERRLGELCDRFAAARASECFAGIDAPDCVALGCAFLRHCHPAAQTR